MIKIKRIIQKNKKNLADINGLLAQWSLNGYQIKNIYFKKLLKQSYVFGMYDENLLIGTATLIPLHKLSGLKGSIEHVIIDEKYRGQGLGKKLMLNVIAVAKKMQMETLCLTCEPDRIVANILYQNLGFIKKETNFYQLKI